MGVLDAFRLDGKVALVSGGSRGLGLQIAEGLGEAGASVAITARRAPGLDQAVEQLAGLGIKATSAVCDISSNAQVEQAVDQLLNELGHIDILVNNAGATWGAPFEELPFEGWDKVIRTNVDGTYFVSRAVGLQMIKQGGGGRIINIASVAGLRGSDPRVMPTLPYNTSKGAVVNFTRALAATLAEHNITVNCICPGFFPTKMTAATLDRFGEEIAEGTPLRRLGGPQDLKGIAVLFASEASAFITGQVIAVDGGATAI
ncbi:MAG: SDR family oxidoreductase [Chloroflexi bacterium]|nr:SDR family oxidoreductase [Chloroflexota bacterium]MBV9897110.1 SDR family oxidoreductase [Chloroflexota bacterium]